MSKESFPRIFNDDIALDKNKLLYVMVLLQEIHISDERSRDSIRKGYEMFTTRVLGEGKVRLSMICAARPRSPHAVSSPPNPCSKYITGKLFFCHTEEGLFIHC